MSYVDAGSFARGPLVSGLAYDRINRFFDLLGQPGGAEYLNPDDAYSLAQRSPLEKRLRSVQGAVSNMSMHLPQGFASGLRRQFANMMDGDAWEVEDDLISLKALNTFLLLLRSTNTKCRPGIGTNGCGSVTATWTKGGNRLTIECLASGRVTVVVSRVRSDGEVERAAFDQIRPDRVSAILAPFDPEVWFDS